ncbi:MAG: PEP-CTERM sorting domain-containing protein [Terrimicrobiaceae bacterium]|nr:PEP-CTERM sorting domain-containing protein [Terrimicrobiaceae bacterium]
MKRLIVAALAAVLWCTSTVQAQINGLDDILFWAGTGSNRSALIVDFQDGNTRSAFAFGYRWDGSATAGDMLTALDGLAGLSISSPGFVQTITYLDPVTGITHSRTAGFFTDYPTDWISWGYFIAGGSAVIYDSNPPYDPIGSLNPPGAGVSVPEGWSISPSGSFGRALADGSWDAFSFGAVDLSFNPVAPPTDTIYAAVPEPSTVGLLLIAMLTLFWHVKRRIHAS